VEAEFGDIHVPSEVVPLSVTLFKEDAGCFSGGTEATSHGNGKTLEECGRITYDLGFKYFEFATDTGACFHCTETEITDTHAGVAYSLYLVEEKITTTTDDDQDCIDVAGTYSCTRNGESCGIFNMTQTGCSGTGGSGASSWNYTISEQTITADSGTTATVERHTGTIQINWSDGRVYLNCRDALCSNNNEASDWTEYKTNWNCGGSSEVQSHDRFETDAECQAFCVDDAFAAQWTTITGNGCRCYSSCMPGSDTSANGQFNTVWTKQAVAQYVSGGSDGSCPAGSVRVQDAECQQLSGVTLSNGEILSSYGREDCAPHFTPGQGCFYVSGNTHAHLNGVTYSTSAGCTAAEGQADHLALCKTQATADQGPDEVAETVTDQAWCDTHCTNGDNDADCPASRCICGTQGKGTGGEMEPFVGVIMR